MEEPQNSYLSLGQPESASKCILIDLIKETVDFLKIDLKFAIA